MSNKNIHLKLKIISYKVGYIFNKNYAKDLNGGCDDTHTHTRTHTHEICFVCNILRHLQFNYKAISKLKTITGIPINNNICEFFKFPIKDSFLSIHFSKYFEVKCNKIPIF